MPRPKKFKNTYYSDSPLIWFSYWFSRWYHFVSLLFLILGILFFMSKVTILLTLYLFVSVWGVIQLLNLFVIVTLRAPLIKFIVIDYQSQSLTISYKYPFGTLKVKILNHNCFAFRVWKNKHEHLTTIKAKGFKITIRDGQFGLDLLELWKLNFELDKIGEKYRRIFDF